MIPGATQLPTMLEAESLAPLWPREPNIVDATVATCPLCWVPVHINEAICPRCGAVFEEDIAMCADCWSRVPISAERCDTCGAFLVE